MKIVLSMRPHYLFTLHSLLFTLFIASCSKTDPVLPGAREPVFAAGEIVVLNKEIENAGARIEPEKCEYTLDGANRIWKGKQRIFAGLPTESEIAADKKVACRGKYIYAGLSTGELVKVDADSRDLIWTADIFRPNAPTGGSPFLDIIAPPVLAGGFVYAGGLGGAFCKLRDKDGSKIWCLPISVQNIALSTENFNFVLTSDGEILAVSTGGKVYCKATEAGKCLEK
jgi:hypothetical protein